MAIEKFKEWYENRYDYQKDWKKRTGGKMVGFFCTYCPEEIYYSSNLEGEKNEVRRDRV